MQYGYARVSTEEQSTNAQRDALKRARCKTIIEEKRSGANMRRPALDQLLYKLRPGDAVVVYKLDRIARSMKDLLLILERIEAAGASFVSLTETIDTATPAGRMMIHILGAFAEFERELIGERTRVGMAAAVARGSILGRPRGLTPTQEKKTCRLFAERRHTKTELARMFDVHISTIKRCLKRTNAA